MENEPGSVHNSEHSISDVPPEFPGEDKPEDVEAVDSQNAPEEDKETTEGLVTATTENAISNEGTSIATSLTEEQYNDLIICTNGETDTLPFPFKYGIKIIKKHIVCVMKLNLLKKDHPELHDDINLTLNRTSSQISLLLDALDVQEGYRCVIPRNPFVKATEIEQSSAVNAQEANVVETVMNFITSNKVLRSSLPMKLFFTTRFSKVASILELEADEEKRHKVENEVNFNERASVKVRKTFNHIKAFTNKLTHKVSSVAQQTPVYGNEAAVADIVNGTNNDASKDKKGKNNKDSNGGQSSTIKKEETVEQSAKNDKDVGKYSDYVQRALNTYLLRCKKHLYNSRTLSLAYYDKLKESVSAGKKTVKAMTILNNASKNDVLNAKNNLLFREEDQPETSQQDTPANNNNDTSSPSGQGSKSPKNAAGDVPPAQLNTFFSMNCYIRPSTNLIGVADNITIFNKAIEAQQYNVNVFCRLPFTLAEGVIDSLLFLLKNRYIMLRNISYMRDNVLHLKEKAQKEKDTTKANELKDTLSKKVAQIRKSQEDLVDATNGLFYNISRSYNFITALLSNADNGIKTGLEQISASVSQTQQPLIELP